MRTSHGLFFSEEAKEEFFFYFPEQENYLSEADYNMLQKAGESCFVPCMKTGINQKPALCYLTEDLVSLREVLPSLKAGEQNAVLEKLFDAVLRIRKKGLLFLRNIDPSPDHIFLNRNRTQVFLVYIPAGPEILPDEKQWEITFREALADLSETSAFPEAGYREMIRAVLQNQRVPLEELRKVFRKAQSPLIKGRGKEVIGS